MLITDLILHAEVTTEKNNNNSVSEMSTAI